MTSLPDAGYWIYSKGVFVPPGHPNYGRCPRCIALQEPCFDCERVVAEKSRGDNEADRGEKLRAERDAALAALRELVEDVEQWATMTPTDPLPADFSALQGSVAKARALLDK